MPLTLDHVVVLVSDLEGAITDYTQLGFTVQRGGTHADGATHNALIGFEDGSYLELLAFLKPAPDHRWAAPQQAGTQGFIDFALLPADLGSVIAAARLRGLQYEGPIDGGRLRPDGERLAWQFGWPPTSDLPFLCGDVTPRALRVREGEVRIHPNGVTGVKALSVTVRDLDASVKRYGALFGADVAARVVRSVLPGTGLRIARFPLGDAELLLVSPIAADATGRAMAQGLSGLALTQAGGTFAHRLPMAATRGAAIELHPDAPANRA